MTENPLSTRSGTVRVSYSFIKIMTGSDLSRRRLPMMAAVSSHPGPVVWLTACSHGDEICGMVIIQELFRKIRRLLTAGSVYAFPLMNPIGFETASRNITFTREDLNRSFPGEPSGTLGRVIAHQIFTMIMETGPSLVIDLHNDWIRSIPYTLIDHDPGIRYKSTYRQIVQLARQSGFVAIRDSERLTSSLTYNLLINDVPALTFELGEPYVINETNVEYGLKAILNLLSHLGMIAPLAVPFRYPAPRDYRARRILRYSDRPYSTKSGIIRFIARPGEGIVKGQPIAKVVNAFGKHQETLRALQDAIVLGHSDSGVVFPGMPVMAFGIIG